MFNSTININENYFYMPFGPVILNPKEIGLKATFFKNIYIDNETGTKWRRCTLYNTGWGQSVGFERLPELEFNDLIKLVLLSNHETTKLSVQGEESNKYGAIAVIMERHINELIDFLSRNLENDNLFGDELYRHNLSLFCFDARASDTNGGIGTKSYEDVLNQYQKWRDISVQVKEKIYNNRLG